MDDIDWQVYIQDLEAKLKSHTEKVDLEGEMCRIWQGVPLSQTCVGLVGDVIPSASRSPSEDPQLNQHTSEIEARLAKSDTRSSALLAQIERHEKDAVDREQAYRDLERHAALLDTRS
jgi:hypothetical protein